jgi:hypothetical protein
MTSSVELPRLYPKCWILGNQSALQLVGDGIGRRGERMKRAVQKEKTMMSGSTNKR